MDCHEKVELKDPQAPGMVQRNQVSSLHIFVRSDVPACWVNNSVGIGPDDSASPFVKASTDIISLTLINVMIVFRQK